MKKRILTKKEKKDLRDYIKKKNKIDKERNDKDRAETIKNYESALSNYKVALARYNELASKCEIEIHSLERLLKSYSPENKVSE